MSGNPDGEFFVSSDPVYQIDREGHRMSRIGDRMRLLPGKAMSRVPDL